MPTVLVVNDEPDQLELLSTILEQRGWEAVSCHNAQEALDFLAQEGPADVLLTDLIMPGIDGWQLCQLLRSPERTEFQHMPILVCSSAVTPHVGRELSRRLGADGFLSTPVQPERLLDTLQTLVSGQRQTDPVQVALVGMPIPQLLELDDITLQPRSLQELEAESFEVVLIIQPTDRVLVREKLRELKKPGSLVVSLLVTDEVSPKESLGWFTAGADAVLPLDVSPENFVKTLRDCQRQRAILRLKELEVERSRKAQLETGAKENLLKWVLDSGS